MRDFQASLKLDSQSPDAYRSLAWLMATCPDPRFRDPEQALSAAQRAARLSPPGDCFVLDALAAAHANAGQFDQAVRYQKEAASIAPPDFQPSFTGRLALYQRRRPFRNAGQQRATATSGPRRSRRTGASSSSMRRAKLVKVCRFRRLFRQFGLGRPRGCADRWPC